MTVRKTGIGVALAAMVLAGLWVALSGPERVAVEPVPVELAATGEAARPRWSVDGRWLAVEVRRGQASAVAMASGAGGRWTGRISPKPRGLGPGSRVGQVAWHPSGALHLTVGGSAGSPDRIYYGQVGAGAPATLLVESMAPESEPSVAPDGQAVAFVAGGDVYLRSVSTGTVTQVSDTPQIEQSPVLDADGTVVFVRDGRLLRWGGAGTVEAVSDGSGRALRPRLADGGLVWFETSSAGVAQMALDPDGVVARQAWVALPSTAAPTAAAGRAVYLDSRGRLVLRDLNGDTIRWLDVGLDAPDDPELHVRDGALWLAFTAVDSAGVRRAWVADLSGIDPA